MKWLCNFVSVLLVLVVSVLSAPPSKAETPMGSARESVRDHCFG